MHTCLLVMVCDPHQECTKWLLLPLLQVEGASCYSVSLPPAIPSLWLACSSGKGLAESYPTPPPSLHGRNDFFHVLFHLMTQLTESMVDIKPSDSGVVIGYQIDLSLTPGQQSTLLIDHTFILVSWARSTLTHFPLCLNQGVRITPFWTK